MNKIVLIIYVLILSGCIQKEDKILKPEISEYTKKDETVAKKQKIEQEIRVSPHYPSFALNKGIEGSVTLQFIVATDGSIKNPVILNSTPQDIFDDVSLSAIKQWKLKPKTDNGVPVEQQLTHTFYFKQLVK